MLLCCASQAITEGLSPGETAGAGLGVGMVVLLLGVSGGIETVNALVPASVVSGLNHAAWAPSELVGFQSDE